jgi:hypothetical protein
MKRRTEIRARDERDSVSIIVKSSRKEASYESHEIIRKHDDIVDEVHAAVARRFRVKNIIVR